MTHDHVRTTEHGGDLDRAISRFGGQRDWLDLSTGINPHAYPLPPIANSLWTNLPDKGLQQDVEARGGGLSHHPALSGSCRANRRSSSILRCFRYITGRRARLLHPSYNEHEGQLLRKNWQVERVCSIKQLAGADLAVVVNPNNPDKSPQPPRTAVLLEQVGVLVIDESLLRRLIYLSARI